MPVQRLIVSRDFAEPEEFMDLMLDRLHQFKSTGGVIAEGKEDPGLRIFLRLRLLLPGEERLGVTEELLQILLVDARL